VRGRAIFTFLVLLRFFCAVLRNGFGGTFGPTAVEQRTEEMASVSQQILLLCHYYLLGKDDTIIASRPILIMRLIIPIIIQHDGLLHCI